MEVNMRKVLCFVSVYLAVASGALAQPRALGHDVRWDLVRIIQGTVLAGGTDVGKIEVEPWETMSLTGSGDAEPAEGSAAGGGTWVFRHFGTEVVRGIYVVTG